MVLDEQQARDIIKTPLNKSQINSVRALESQLRVFTEEMSETELITEPYWGSLLNVIKKRSAAKYDRVTQFIRYSLPVVQISDSVLTDYYRLFEGKNRYFNVNGDRDIDRLKTWINTSLLESWIENHARMVFKNKPNSFVVVDQEPDGTPYVIYIDSERLVDAKFKNEKGDLDYIAFIHSQTAHETQKGVITTLYSVYDDTTYYVFSKNSNSDHLELISEAPHNIGWCPGRSFVSTPTNSKNLFKRRVAFSSALPSLEDWTIFDIFRNYVDHYAPFPITEAPKKACQNNECQGGKVQEEVIVDVKTGQRKQVWHECPVCEGGDKGELIGPGTHIGIKVKADKDKNDASGIFRMIFPDVDKLKYVPEKLDGIESEIKNRTVGLNTMVSNEAINSLQVKGSFASMESILLRNKSELDLLYQWIVKTVSRLFYKDIDVNVEANYGTEFYLVTEQDLQERYKKAKEIGLPSEELMMIYTQLIETKYKGNTDKVARQKMILELDPLPLFSVKEALELADKNRISERDLSLKINLLNFITKFEKENASITQFGMGLEPSERVRIIRETLNNYNDETIKSKQSSSSN